MSRHLTALVLAAAVLAASTIAGVDARVVHPGPYHVVIRSAGEPGRRLIGIGNAADICKEVHYKTLCGTLTTLPGVMTPQQLLDAALRVAATKAGMAGERVNEVIKSSKGKDGGGMSSALGTCKTSYASLVEALQKARRTLNGGGGPGDLMTEKARRTLNGGGSHDNLMTDLSAASTFSTDCSDAFDDFPDLTLPIPGVQRHVTRLVTNCLDLAATIKQVGSIFKWSCPYDITLGISIGRQRQKTHADGGNTERSANGEVDKTFAKIDVAGRLSTAKNSLSTDYMSAHYSETIQNQIY
uniref:Pectinesterase inhibitor domain-containing protein n=1 Tax=Oryza brachyantha TaxID=4533 RepID=J3L3A4_ORYBR